TDEGTGSRPGVSDVPSDDSEEELSWSSSNDEDVSGQDEGDKNDENVDDQTKGSDENEGEKTDENYDDDNDDQDKAKKVNDDDDDEEEISKIAEQEADYKYLKLIKTLTYGVHFYDWFIYHNSYTFTPIHNDSIHHFYIHDSKPNTNSSNTNSKFRSSKSSNFCVVQTQTDRLQDSIQRENDEFLKTIDDNMKKIIKEQVKTQVKAQVTRILPRIEESMNAQLEAEVLTRSSDSLRTSYAVAADLSEMELKKNLIDKMEGNKSIQRSDKQGNLYKALVEAYDADKTILDTYGESTILKRRHEEDDDQEGPSAGLDRGSKRRRE
nr:hypothetical protein [Tanacetum cinerariifolium]